MSRFPRLVAVLSVLIVAALSGCNDQPSSATPTPTAAGPTPTPLIAFADRDTPIDQVGADLRALWKAYDVLTVPSRHTFDTTPAPPAVANSTNGVVPDDMALKWARAYIHDRAWQKWAYAHAQTDFFKHLVSSGASIDTSGGGLSGGASEAVPDCAAFPTTMQLVQVNKGSNIAADASQYAFINTFTGPCTATFNFPDGSTKPGLTIADTLKTVEPGWLISDPVLGSYWYDEGVGTCDTNQGNCPEPTPPPATAPKLLPAADTPIAQAPAALQAIWQPYELVQIPGAQTIGKIPAAPTVDNQTRGIVTDAEALQWAKGFMLDATWQRYAWDQVQLPFLNHLSQGNVFSGPLSQAAGSGARAAVPACAVYPTSLALSFIGYIDASNSPVTSTHSLFLFTAKYSSGCKFSARFPDGHSTDITQPETAFSAGSYRQDPVLGWLWYADQVAVPTH